MTTEISPTAPWARFSRRFWSKVDRSGECWIWTASQDHGGYGKFGVGAAGWTRAHRVAHELFIAPIPVGTDVLHRCDNPPCVRPDHLYLGTPADNTHDAMAKRRLAVGERNGAAKLTAASAAEIRARHSAGESQAALGRRFRVTQRAVWQVVHGLTWAER